MTMNELSKLDLHPHFSSCLNSSERLFPSLNSRFPVSVWLWIAHDTSSRLLLLICSVEEITYHLHGTHWDTAWLNEPVTEDVSSTTITTVPSRQN